MTATLDANKAAQTYAIDKTHSEVAFQVRHLLTKVRGRFTEFTGTVVLDQEHPDQSSASLTIDASSIDTGTPDRDTHLRAEDFFAVGTHPMLTFTSSRVVKTGDDSYDVAGTLTIRGVAREITMPVTYLGAATDPWGSVRAGLKRTSRSTARISASRGTRLLKRAASGRGRGADHSVDSGCGAVGEKRDTCHRTKQPSLPERREELARPWSKPS